MKKQILFLSLLVITLTANAQFYPFLNTSGYFGFGYKKSNFSPYIGLSFGSYFEQTYDKNTDTLINNNNWNVVVSPRIGLDYYFIKDIIDLYGVIEIGTAVQANDIYDISIYPVIGLGIEKSIDNFSISGQLCLNSGFSKYENSPKYISYLQEISIRPIIILKYYLKNKQKAN